MSPAAEEAAPHYRTCLLVQEAAGGSLLEAAHIRYMNSLTVEAAGVVVVDMHQEVTDGCHLDIVADYHPSVLVDSH